MKRKIQLLKRYAIAKAVFSQLPKVPGVYFFWQKQTPLYIGKAVNLKSRLASYLAINLGPKTKQMITTADAVSFIKVGSELEALLLEAALIHQYQPKYNLLAKDDKHALYIKISKEKYPRVQTARKIDERSQLLAFYGPFPSAKIVNSVLRLTRKVFPFSTHKPVKKACLNSQIGLCHPCPSAIENEPDPKKKKAQRKSYLNNINNIKALFDGRSNYLLHALEKNLKSLASQEKFEEAAQIKKQIDWLNYIRQPIIESQRFLANPNLLEDVRAKESADLKMLLRDSFPRLKSLKRIECFDVAHTSGLNPTASMITFIQGEAETGLYRRFKIHQKAGSDDLSSLTEVASRRLSNLKKWGRPDLIIVDGGKTQTAVFTKTFFPQGIPVVGLVKNPERLVVPKDAPAKHFAAINIKSPDARHLLERLRDEAHRFARKYHHQLSQVSLIETKNH